MPLPFIQTVFSPWLIIFCIAIAVASALFLYRNDRAFKDSPRSYIRILTIIRAVVLFVILFFLLQPFVRLFNRVEEKPLLLFAQDNSGSIVLTGKGEYYKKDYKEALNRFLEKYSDDAIVQVIPFGDQSRPGDSINYSNLTSDYQEMLQYVRNTYNNRHVGALVIAGDGILNRGADPSLNDAGLWFPVYTIAMGDTSVSIDAAVKDVLYNKVTYAGNRFALKSYIIANRCRGEKLRITISSEGAQLFSKEIVPASDQWVYELSTDLPADKPGIKHYTLSVSAVKGEKNTMNNSQDIWVEVIESRRKILILYNSPHPDIGAIQQSLAVNGQYETQVLQANEFKGNIQTYDVVIFHQIPSKSSGATELFKSLAAAEKPAWFILGSQSNISAFNALGTGLKITSSGQVYDESTPAFNGNFALFQWSENIPAYIALLPPLICPFGDYNTLFQQNSMLFQKIKNITTSRPMMLYCDIPSQGKYAITTGEGIWRWRLKCHSEYGNFDYYNELVARTVQYLSSGKKKERFIVSARRTYSENEAITAGAELYDESYKPDNRYDVFMTLSDTAGRKYDYVFAKQGDFYRLSCGILEPGRWKWHANVKAGSESFDKYGEFVVAESLLENNDLTARHDIMNKLATANGGIMVSDTSFSRLENALKDIPSMKPISHSEYDMYDLIELRFILIAIVLLLSIEWFFRKFFGSY